MPRHVKNNLVFHEIAQLSNHTHALVTASCMEALADFQQFVNGQLAKRTGWEFLRVMGRGW